MQTVALDSSYIIGSPLFIIHGTCTDSGGPWLQDEGLDVEQVKHLPVTGRLFKSPSRPLFASAGKRSMLSVLLHCHGNIHIYLIIYMRIKKYITMKIENRSICSEVISVKLFCREKVLRMYCIFILFCCFFANKLLCLCQCIFFSRTFISFVAVS